MVRYLIRVGIFLGSAAVGLFIASVALSGFTITPTSFLMVVVLFAILQAVLTPSLSKVADKKAPALVGLVGLASTFLALLVTKLLFTGVTISGIGTWLLATLIVWVVTLLAAVLLPKFFLKDRVQSQPTAAK